MPLVSQELQWFEKAAEPFQVCSDVMNVFRCQLVAPAFLFDPCFNHVPCDTLRRDALCFVAIILVCSSLTC